MSRHSNPFARKPIETLLKEMDGGERLHRVLGPVALTALQVGVAIVADIFVFNGQEVTTFEKLDPSTPPIPTATAIGRWGAWA